jgi:hypothetical protein
MSPREYFAEIRKRAFKASKKAVHELHFWILIVAGIALALVNLHLEEYALAIVLPLVVFVAAFIASLLWQGYVIYREELDKRLELEKQLAATSPNATFAREREKVIHDQVAGLSEAEKESLRRLLLVGTLTQMQNWTHLRSLDLSTVALESLAEKVGFLHREPVRAAWYILPEFVPFVRSALLPR